MLLIGSMPSKCSKCKRIKPFRLFRKNKTRKNGLNSACKSCDTKARNISRKLIAQSIYDYLLNNPCVDCGEDNVLALQFDHINPKTKSFEISEAARKFRSFEPVMVEIKKCNVRCANCHQIKTSVEQNHNRYKIYSKLLDSKKK